MAFPGITAEEINLLQRVTFELNDQQKQYFYTVYSTKRKNPHDIFIYCLIGLIILPGLQRFVTGRIDWEIFYLLTWGLCFIGSIVDLINYTQLADDFNYKMAAESYRITKMSC